jgi:hypothetical protein
MMTRWESGMGTFPRKAPETHQGFQMFPVSFAHCPVTGQKDTASIPCALSCPGQVPLRGIPRFHEYRDKGKNDKRG